MTEETKSPSEVEEAVQTTEAEEEVEDERTEKQKKEQEKKDLEAKKEALKSKLLTKKEILDADDLPTEIVPVLEWNGAVRLRTMTGVERERFENKVSNQMKGKKLDTTGLRIHLLSMVIVHEDGSPMFDKKDLVDLNKKSSKAINDLFQKTQEMNGIGDDAVEELSKNLKSDQN